MPAANLDGRPSDQAHEPDRGPSDDFMRLAYGLADLSGLIDGVERRANATLDALRTLRSAGGEIGVLTKTLRAGVGDLSQAARRAGDEVDIRIERVEQNGARLARLAEWGTGVPDRTATLQDVVAGILTGNTQVEKIARQVSMLAVNASIEAARAGEAGRGFAVVAEAIGDLSRQTARVAAEIRAAIAQLDEWSRDMRDDAERLAPEFRQGQEAVRETLDATRSIGATIAAARGQAAALDSSIASFSAATDEVDPAMDAIGAAAGALHRDVDHARSRAHRMMDRCEAMLTRAATSGDRGAEARFVAIATDRAAQIAAAFSDGIARDEIAPDGLFSQSYRRIEGSDPAQYLAPFSAFADRVLPAILDGALADDPAILFCCACDRNGYVPTHNRRFSHPQGPDPRWNAAHSRNRRIFDDRVGLKAGRNEAAFLLQVYRRDMGGDGIVMMKDLSVPIRVGPHHWGGLRLGYADDAITGPSIEGST